MSDIDRQLVEEAFDSNEIFSKAQNPQLRDQIRSRVLRFKGLVPSLKSYQENMKYISIGVTVVDDLMFPDSARTKSWKRQQTDRRTFRDMLRQHWSPPRQNLVEVREGVLAQCVGEPVFDVAYKQVVLAAMRNFPHLSDQFKPRKDSTENRILQGTDPEVISVFYNRASMLGFNIPNCNLPQRRPCIPVTSDVDTGVEIPLSQRWGVPYVGVLRAIRDVMFLPQLAEAQPPRASVIFVQKDLIYSFLGACGLYRLSDETVTLDGRLVQSWTSDREVHMEQRAHVDSPQRPPTDTGSLLISDIAAPLTVSHRNSQDARVQNIAARHQVEHNRPDSIMSLTAVVQDPMGEWLEASLARAQHVEFGLETSYLSRTSSQSRSGIDTPLHSWSGRESTSDTRYNMATIRPRLPTSSTYVTSPLSMSSRSAIESIDFSALPGHFEPQGSQSKVQESTIPAINLGREIRSARPLSPVSSLPWTSATQDLMRPSMPLRPINLHFLKNDGLSENTVSTPDSSTIHSRSDIGARSLSQTEQSWFRRLPPLKLYLPSLQRAFESHLQAESGPTRRFDDGMSPLNSVPLSPASGHSRSEIGTPLMTQHGRTCVRQEMPRYELVNQDQYWDIV
ncbi:hypothetical protein CLIM01_13019 [Colletotrichum limetticola]|uniref:Uncharacterized protein n=1 Tax=Colletotrichum limetticola TaxID=1209924 RepID=A0ABQ9PEJ5_9PEZI|nr:hypothetical protein CLIM01_13019 [Colletotrichum limetticola]